MRWSHVTVKQTVLHVGAHANQWSYPVRSFASAVLTADCQNDEDCQDALAGDSNDDSDDSGSGLFVMCINTVYKYNEIWFAQSILSLRTAFSATKMQQSQYRTKTKT